MKEIYKDWLRTIIIILALWVIGNASVIGFSMMSSGEMFGEDSFWSALWFSLVVEFFILLSATIISIAFVWLFKSLLKNGK